MDLLYYLKTFVCLAESKTMKEAMNRLLYSQPTISTHLAHLDKYYGCPLLTYRNKQYFLTEEGACLYHHALKLLGLEAETAETMAGYNNLKHGSFAVGASSNIGVYTLPRVLGVFNQNHPGIKVEVTIDKNYTIEKKVAEYQLGIGVVETDVSDLTLKTELLKREPLLLIVSPSHPWAGLKHIQVQELLQQPFVVGEPGSGTNRALERQIGALASQLKVSFQLGSTEAVKKAVESSLGISIVVGSSVTREIAMKTLVAVPIKGVNLYKDYRIISRKEGRLNESIKRFIALLRSIENMTNEREYRASS